MSWNISVQGTKAAVMREVEAQFDAVLKYFAGTPGDDAYQAAVTCSMVKNRALALLEQFEPQRWSQKYNAVKVESTGAQESFSLTITALALTLDILPAEAQSPDKIST
jgi:hypothetical protein